MELFLRKGLSVVVVTKRLEVVDQYRAAAETYACAVCHAFLDDPVQLLCTLNTQSCRVPLGQHDGRNGQLGTGRRSTFAHSRKGYTYIIRIPSLGQPPFMY